MFLENLVFDAVDPQRLGRFWEAVIGGETLTDDTGIFETRLEIDGGWYLDLCFQQVPERPSAPPRLHLDLLRGSRTEAADPEGNPVGVREEHADTGPVAALRLDSADPSRDSEFWARLTGWVDQAGSLRHPSGRGPLLELVPEERPKGEEKNRIHLDVRLEPGEDADDVEASIAERGGTRLHPGWGELPWRSYTDPSGNEFCVLPARA